MKVEERILRAAANARINQLEHELAWLRGHRAELSRLRESAAWRIEMLKQLIAAEEESVR